MSVVALVLGKRLRQEIRREFRAHRDECVARLVAEGMTPEAAQVEAASRFGDEDVHARRCEQESLGSRLRELRILALAALVVGAGWVGVLFATADQLFWPYLSVLYSHLLYGLPAALVAGACAVGIGNLWVRHGIMVLGTVTFWVALFLGTHIGYGAWQSIDNPPEEAYADGANLVGSLIGGWIPGGVLVALAYALGTLGRRLLPPR